MKIEAHLVLRIVTAIQRRRRCSTLSEDAVKINAQNDRLTKAGCSFSHDNGQPLVSRPLSGQNGHYRRPGMAPKAQAF